MARKTGGGGKRPAQSNSDELLWLETFFIVFPHKRRPTLAQVEHALAQADPRLQLVNLAANDEGLFESLMVDSREDHAAVEVSYETGAAVIEQNLEWAKQLQDELAPNQLQQLVAADARLDLVHFERVQGGSARPQQQELRAFAEEDEDPSEDFDEEAAMEVFDPTCLLTVVEALSSLTKGLTFDPASGEML